MVPNNSVYPYIRLFLSRYGILTFDIHSIISLTDKGRIPGVALLPIYIREKRNTKQEMVEKNISIESIEG